MQRKQSEPDTFSTLRNDPLSLTLTQIAWLADRFFMTAADLATQLIEESK